MYGRPYETKHTDWVFTINNYTPTHVKRLRTKFYNYIVFGYEMSKTMTPHLQGYIQLTHEHTMLEVKKLFKTRKVWLQPRRGTALEASNYCKKTGEYEEYGFIFGRPDVLASDRRRLSLPFVRNYKV